MAGKSLSIEVSLASVGEAEEISALAESIWTTCYAELLSAGQIRYMLDWMYAPVRIRREILEQEIVYRWLLINGERVGFAASGPSQAGSDEVVHKLYVSPESQGRGLGTAAMAAIEASARASGAKRLTLRVNRGNRTAIQAYEKFGFEREAEVCSDIGGGFVMDDYVMAKRLSK